MNNDLYSSCTPLKCSEVPGSCRELYAQPLQWFTCLLAKLRPLFEAPMASLPLMRAHVAQSSTPLSCLGGKPQPEPQYHKSRHLQGFAVCIIRSRESESRATVSQRGLKFTCDQAPPLSTGIVLNIVQIQRKQLKLQVSLLSMRWPV